MGVNPYGYPHRKARRYWRRIIDRQGWPCCLCPGTIQPGQPFDLDHDPADPTRTTYRGPSHPSCNRSDGATRGNRQRAKTAKQRWAL